MRKCRSIFFVIFYLLVSCASQEEFFVKNIIDTSTIELENNTVVKLIGVNRTTNKYVEALKNVKNNFVLLYDENYEAINDVEEGIILAYVYNVDGDCINEFAEAQEGESESKVVEINQPTQLQTEEELKERISGKNIDALPNSNLSEMYEKNKYAVFLIAVPITAESYAQGTGFFIASSGIGVSNYHVFENGDKNEAIIKTIDNHTYRIKKILKEDKELDYIVFEVENDHFDFPYLIIAEQVVGVGNDVFAIGNPKGLEHTLSKGIVSSYREDNNLIQTTTEITHGSSGGPLFNMRGEVIGITTSGIGEANLNFAMNIQKLDVKSLIHL